MLAASVVAASGTSDDPLPRSHLILLVLITGVVFWAAHVYARLAGERAAHRQVDRREVRRVAVGEWSIVEAALLPAIAVAASPLLGIGLPGTYWLALGVAVGQQVAWAVLGALRAGVSRGQAAVEGAVNLVLGLIIVVAKAALGH
ncbi:MAG: hypothetical protein HOV68_23070 [Streptomycetaceae bacterium]|nr:hypothetical protein [Streptomycetaceae bacterium]